MLKALTRGLVVLLVLVMGSTAYGQGVQTGILTGSVVDVDGLVLPGVTVTVTSPALQGARTTVTDANGVYSVRGLPPGQYTLQFELSGMRNVEATQRVDLGLTARVDAKMQLATLTENVTVTAELPTLVTTTTGGANYRMENIDRLATGRSLQGVAELAPGLTDNTPNAGQVTISGGFAYDNQFLVDGVDVADNMFANPNNLFIEDAIEEVQVLTSGISAEYGRFSGGVVNAVTKSGGNTFSGSFRGNLWKPSWTTETPFETTPRSGPMADIYEWTVGGPVMKDRVWFFHAGRLESSSNPTTLPVSRAIYDATTDNKRFEIKGTGTVARNQTVYASYLRNNTDQTTTGTGGASDPSTVVSRTLPNDLVVGGWRGVVTDKLFATLQISRREFGFRNQGGTSTSLVDSPFISRGAATGVQFNRFYNAPYFDSSDPEDRNNRQVAASVSYFLTTPNTGSHDFKFGYENFQSTNRGGNSQSATNYVFLTDYLLQGGAPALDNSQRLIPTFVPGTTLLQNWLPVRGATIDVTTQSFYAHDHWAATARLTLDVGVRYERVRSEATGGIVGVDTDTWVPRLGATYNVTGDGRTTAQATYARYAGKYSEAQFASNTNVGNPSLLILQYAGPAGSGRDFAPGFNLANYRLVTGSFPTDNVFFEEGLRSPISSEFTLSLARQLGEKGAVKGTYQWRSLSGFFEDYIDDPTLAGRTTVVRDGIDFGTFDNITFRNTGDDAKRDYQALIMQGNYRVSDKWTVNGHWTVQLKNDGNIEGEAPSQPGAVGVLGDYPEIYVPSRNFPEGRLNDFQRHKVRAWTNYTLDFGGVGAFDVSLIARYDSPLTFSYSTTGVDFSAIQLARDPGYASPPADQTIFFGERGAGRFESATQFDLAVHYQIPLFKTLRPWAKFELYNVFNNQSLVGFNTNVVPDENGPVDANGIPTQFIRDPAFGTATGASSYPQATRIYGSTAVYARTFLMSVGVRF